MESKMNDNFYVWGRDPKSQSAYYVGEFLQAEVALAWVKKQKVPESFRITNVAPTAVVREHRVTPETVDADEDKSLAYEAVKGYLDNPESAGYMPDRRAERQAPPRRGEVLHNPYDIGTTATKTRRTVIAPVAPVKPKRVKTADELKLEADAKAALIQHRADEAAELAAEEAALQD
jgi:hypothetical protein